ncbi:MAG TPA: hypothetical protein QGF02_03305 [Candidatus Babeliales bacterium]|nr:hypothetical protein [Candidatus Babeliales bacterium]
MKKKYFFYDEQSGKCNDSTIRELVINLNKVLEVGKLELLLKDAENEAREKNVKEITYKIKPNGGMTIGQAPTGWNCQFQQLFKDILQNKINKLTQLFFDGYHFYLDVKNKDQVIQDCLDIQLLTHAKMGPWLTTINYNYDTLSPFYDAITMSMAWVDAGFKDFSDDSFGYGYDTTHLEIEGDKVIIYESFSDEEHMINRSEYPLKAFWDLSVRFHNQVTIPGKGKKEEFWQIAWDGKEFGLYVELS